MSIVATIKDAVTGQLVTGKIVSRHDKGLCIDDQNGVRYYATTDRVLKEQNVYDMREAEALDSPWEHILKGVLE
jgi:hypothetical protein